MLFEVQATLLGVAALLSALGGVVSTVWAIRKGRREERDQAHQECLDKLRETRAEAETLANELHQLRMGVTDGAD